LAEGLRQDSILVMEVTASGTPGNVILGDCDCLAGDPTLHLAGDARVLANHLLHGGHDRRESVLHENLPCAEGESHDTNTMGGPLDQEGDNYDPSDLDAEQKYPGFVASPGCRCPYWSGVVAVDPAFGAS
jgi:hypothetical protein